MPPLRIGVMVWPGYSFIYLARALGLLSSDLVSVQEMHDLAAGPAALLDGRVDAVALTLDQALDVQDRGVDIRVVLVFDTSAGGDAVMAVQDIESPAGLRGRHIGIDGSTLSRMMLAELLAAGGLTEKDVDVVVNDDDHVHAWERGGLDAIVTYTPYIQVFKNKGLNNLFDSRRLPQSIVDVLAVRTSSLPRHATAVRAAVAAHFDAQMRWRQNPFDYEYQLAHILRMSVEDTRTAFVGLDLPDARYNYHYLSAPATELSAAIQSIRNVAHPSLPTRPGAFPELFTPDYLPALPK